MLSDAQTDAIAHVRARAAAARPAAVETIDRLGRASGLDLSSVVALVRGARVTVSFHPDRRVDRAGTVVERLLAEGIYESQFVTGVSNGGRTAYVGGHRDAGEARLFGGAYQRPSVLPGERPKYGGLDPMRHADGACPRFGACYLELSPHVATRCTFTWGDTYGGPEIPPPAHVGTADVLEPIVAALLEKVSAHRNALGVSDLDIAALVDRLRARELGPPGRALDAYIEAQIHGQIDLAKDVEAIVVDASFEGTSTYALLRELASFHRFELRRHPGFVLDAREVRSEFRGPRMPPLAARIADRFARRAGEIDVVALGHAAESLELHPEAWTDWGPYDETFQEIKQLWHTLVRFGRAV